MLLTPMSPVFAVVIDGSGDADLTAADIVSEDTSKREKFSRHYLTGDGTYFAVSYAEQVNYQDLVNTYSSYLVDHPYPIGG